MAIPTRLGDYPTTPLYNIKAVVQATGISPSTLRAWERRYQMCRPQRSESGYRLYSERDIVVIRWLKAQVDAGMAISQAVSWYENILADAGGPDATVLPAPSASGSVLETGNFTRSIPRSEVRDFAALQNELLAALSDYDEDKAETVISEAFSLYTIEEVGEQLFVPVLIEVGERWHRGELAVAGEHFASNYILQRLTAILRAMPDNPSSPLIWVGCAPGELHEVGAVLLALYLRRAGYRVRYLGQSVPMDGLAEDARKHAPAMILFSATTKQSALDLAQLTVRLGELSPRPIIGYGGQVFNRHHDLRNRVTGVYMGANGEEAVNHVRELLSARQVREHA